MKYLIVEKLPDGRFQTTSWINKDGSSTIQIFDDAQSASKIDPVLGKTLSGLPVDSDMVSISFNGDGTVCDIHAKVNSKDKDDAGFNAILKTEETETASSKIYDLRADLEAKAGVPITPIKKEDPIDPVDPLTP